MLCANVDSAINHAFELVALNFDVQTLFTHFGFDPAHLSFHAVIARLWEIALANINTANLLALAGSLFYVATLMMRTIVPLRVIGIISMAFFIAYGAVAGAVSTLLLYLLSLPVNIIRLRQMLHLVKKARTSAQGDLSMDWLRPYMTPRRYKKGDTLFRKGDVANEMFLIVTGRFLVIEIGVELAPGRIMGELGFAAPKNRRTQTIQCIENGDVLTITYETLLELYFQNPEFGYYLLSLTAERLLQNASRLETALEECRARLQQMDAMHRSGAAVSAPRSI
ncbi:MAG TPA: cyclic nucleotide-binding domain-containing protein [Pseudolabrys sp.]|nr:cyclic nucleotide-binding domain-containing protein [Pseudolabrys sp.]